MNKNRVDKSRLVIGCIAMFIGLGAFMTAVVTETKLDGIFWGLMGSGIAVGITLIAEYLQWYIHRDDPKYQEMLERKEIAVHDEMIAKVKDKAGRRAYVCGVYVVVASMIIFSILGALEVVEGARTVVVYLGFYLIFQAVVGILFFNKTMRNY